jgi:hypothetical protein
VEDDSRPTLEGWTERESSWLDAIWHALKGFALIAFALLAGWATIAPDFDVAWHLRLFTGLMGGVALLWSWSAFHEARLAWYGLPPADHPGPLERFHRWQRSRREPELTVDDRGIESKDGERLAFRDLEAVYVETNALGPYAEDFFFVLETDRHVSRIPLELARREALDLRLFELPGFDTETFLRATACAEEDVFHCWKADRVDSPERLPVPEEAEDDPNGILEGEVDPES